MNFTEWLTTFIDEKGLNLEGTFDIEVDGNLNIMPLGVIVEMCMQLGKDHQHKIKDTLVKLDFMNRCVLDYFKFLANGLVKGMSRKEQALGEL